MPISNLPFLLGAPASGAKNAAAGGGNFSFFIMMGLVFLVMYLFMIRPQSKKRKELEKKINAMKKGDKVVSIGGIRGEVHSVKEGTVLVRVDGDTKLEFSKSAIAEILGDTPAPEKKGK